MKFTLEALARSGAAAPTKAGKAAPPVDCELSVMLYDSRFPQSVAYAEQLAGPSVLLVDTHERDIGLAWHQEIKAHLAAQPGAIAGMSLHSDQMISEIMGREHGMKHLISVRVEDAPSLYSWRIA